MKKLIMTDLLLNSIQILVTLKVSGTSTLVKNKEYDSKTSETENKIYVCTFVQKGFEYIIDIPLIKKGETGSEIQWMCFVEKTTCDKDS